MENFMCLEFPSKSCNESFARAAVGAFATQLDLNIDELADIKTAVSEAVTNSIVHGYQDSRGIITIKSRIFGNEVEIIDKGCGIDNVDKAMQPMFSTVDDDDRSGMGFTVMQSFMDNLSVISRLGEGTHVTMTKIIGADRDE
ncbi:MAG: anti-sigma F factor [Oscillospiraceae bacterium]